MTTDKDFLTYHQQMRHLRDDKHIACAGTSDKTILCRYGYFNLVNGYKNPFVSGVDAMGNHCYYPGTDIKHLNAVKMFDEELRMHLLKYIVRTEEEVRTFAAYKFDEVNEKGGIPWYQVDAFDANGNVQDIVGIISKAYSEISKSHAEYIGFYLKNHKIIPTWILVKAINFSTFIDFVNCSKRQVKDSLCTLYGMVDQRGFANHKLLIGSLHCMRKVRNMCAHNERIYTFDRKSGRIKEPYLCNLAPSYSREDNQRIIDLLVYLKYYLCSDDYYDLIIRINDMLSTLQSQIAPEAFNYVRAKIGVKNMSHLQYLLLNPKSIKYNAF